FEQSQIYTAAIFGLFASAYSAGLSAIKQYFPLTINQPFRLFYNVKAVFFLLLYGVHSSNFVIDHTYADNF
ncbi:hypothetical protein Q6247_25925, partial [Klebsiella pneumoniae]